MPLKKLIDNKAGNYDELCQDKIKILGNYQDVAFCADLYAQKKDLLFLIQTNALLEFCEEHNFDTDVFAAFKLGLSVFPKFLQGCVEEIGINEAHKANVPKSD